jgi:(R)-2-hydroxyacyl-CoA dehydratese activating ATPase
MIVMGIDVGSISTKAAVINDGKIAATKVIATGYHAQKAAKRVYRETIAAAGFQAADVAKIVATGYGRNSVDFAHKAITEITCHAAGAHYLDPSVRTIIDIGGQDSKVIAIDENGQVKDFAMNDKCAAGTGRFLEVMARALEVELAQFGSMSIVAKKPASISSLCTVFAESEVISLIAKGEVRENIIAGIHNAISARVVAMGGRVGLRAPLMMTGGVAKNIGVLAAIREKTGQDVIVSDKAQVNGAIGAALMAAKTL